MGFNKRYLSKEKILSNLSNIDNLLKADSLIMDQWASYFIQDLRLEERDLRKKLIEDTIFYSGDNYKNHQNFHSLNSLSETLINLSTDPYWVDIHITFIKTNFKIEESEIGKFELLKDKSIKSIILYYDNLLINSRDKKLNEVLS